MHYAASPTAVPDTAMFSPGFSRSGLIPAPAVTDSDPGSALRPQNHPPQLTGHGRPWGPPAERTRRHGAVILQTWGPLWATVGGPVVASDWCSSRAGGMTGTSPTTARV